MLLSLAILTLALLVGMPLTPGLRRLALYCVFTPIYWMPYTAVLHVVTHESSTAQKITCCRSASKCKMMCYFLMLFLYEPWVGQR